MAILACFSHLSMRSARTLAIRLVCGFRNREFQEEERKKGKYGGLKESDEKFEHHERHWQEIWHEICRDENDYFTRQNVAKKTE